MSEIDAVVFDVGRVIVQWDLRHLFSKLIADAEELDWFLDNVVTLDWHFEHDSGRPLNQMLPDRKAQFPQYADHLDAYATRFLETIPGPVPGTAQVITDLDAAGHKLFGITNFGSEFWQQFRPTCPVLDRFGDIVVSGDEKLTKPDPAIFHLAAERFGHPAKRMLFIDDSQANSESASILGWQVHHFQDAVGLRSDLEARGLLR